MLEKGIIAQYSLFQAAVPPGFALGVNTPNINNSI
jgi:hypothetical protein